MAVEMSTMPFKNFGFDGILGMGLKSLALSKEFSFFDTLSNSGSLPSNQFGVFLTEGDDGDESEMAFGGYNTARVMPNMTIDWTSVVMPEMGYWQVEILALRVGGRTLDICSDGGCRGVMDTGTSHLGIPAPYDVDVAEMLTVQAGDMMDCRLADLPELEIELPGMNITLYPETYMRRLPLREDVNVDAPRGAALPTHEQQMKSKAVETSSATIEGSQGDVAGSVPRICRPRLMPVNMPAPLGPKLFILGEPVFHRYYAVFDWDGPRIGMAVANSKRNLVDKASISDRIGALPKDMDVFLMQRSVNTSHECAQSKAMDSECPRSDFSGPPQCRSSC
jgi:hypothetical protein